MVSSAATSGRVSAIQRRDEVRHLDQRRLLRPPPEIFDYIARARSWSRSRSSGCIAGATSCWRLPPRGLLGADGHVQGQAGPRGAARERRRAVGGLGARSGPRTATRARSLGLMLPLLLGRPRAGPLQRARARRPLRRHRDRLRRHAAAPDRRRPPARGALGRAQRRRGARRPRPAPAPRRCSRASRAAMIVRPRLPGRLLPLRGAGGQGLLRGAEGATVAPDLIFTHQRDDLHQDHRLVSELTWNTFRDHLILEYEIPKYDGDLGAPNCSCRVRRALAAEDRAPDAATSRPSARKPGSSETCSAA